MVYVSREITNMYVGDGVQGLIPGLADDVWSIVLKVS